MNLVLHVNSLDLPRVAIAEPVVRDFDLVAILDNLLKNSVIVADAVSPCGIVQGG